MTKPVFSALMGLGLTLTTLGSLSAPGLEAQAETEPTWHNCLTREVFTPEKRAWCDRWQTLQNGTYIIPTGFEATPAYTTVTLENGEYEQVDGQLLVSLANEPGWLTFGDINGDGKDDAAVIFGVVQGGGTALVTYLTAVMDIDGDAQALNPVALGDRILLNAPMTIDNSRINVPQLTQTEVINRAFVTDGGTLSELAQLPTPERVPGGVPDGTVVFSQTSSYAVRVFTQGGQPRINLFNKATGLAELTAATAIAESSVEGNSFTHAGSGGEPSVRVQVANSGEQTLEVNDNVLQDSAQVTGTVTYLPRIAMPPNAVLEVTLADVSRADAPAIVLASQGIIFGDRQVPIPFALTYDPKQIDPRFTYVVQARIVVDGQLRFISTTSNPVITRGNPTQVEIVVDQVN
ncbi:MAG: YbaY family lipoprotein [Nodosilinea sp.]